MDTANTAFNPENVLQKNMPIMTLYSKEEDNKASIHNRKATA